MHLRILSLLLLSSGLAIGQEDASRRIEAAGQQFLLRADEYKQYQIEASSGLADRTLAWIRTDGLREALRFDGGGELAGYGRADRTLSVSARVFELAPKLYYVSFPFDDGDRALTAVIDEPAGTALLVDSRRPGPEDGTHRAQTAVTRVMLEGDRAAPAPQPSEGMVGARLVARYADDIAYEHIYLNPHFVTWHGTEGPEAGNADTEWYDAYELRDGVYLVSWSEKVLTTHMLFLFDFNSGHEIGSIFGYEPESGKRVFDTIGAKMEVQSPPRSIR